jgi:sporulation protein YlmC with PRC-barrel domain
VLDRAYWLNHCHGFLVNTLSGEEVGVVDEVETDPQTGDATTLIVSSGWFGRRRLAVPVDDVETIYASSRGLIVRGAPQDVGSGPRRRSRR